MRQSKPTQRALALALALSSLSLSACSEEKKDKEAAQPAAADPGADANPAGGNNATGGDPQAPAGPGAPVTIAVPDYPALYCQYAGQVKTRFDVSPELSYFCRDGKPTPEMLGLREALIATPGHIRPRVLKEKHTPEEDKSEFILAWGYYVPIRPFEVKGRPLYEYIAKSITKEDILLSSTTIHDGKEKLDHGLHLWSAKMHYDLSVKATNGLSLDSLRDTEFNMYQVQSGNEEMGFGVESSTDPDNPDYYRSVMINLSFNDGSGYNDGKGGALVMNLLHLVINNRGFPVTASKSVDEIGSFLADSMYEGLKQ